MQIFEFHFNPKKKDQALNSFCHEPEKNSSKKGYLYMAGELLNALPGSEQFINNLAKNIKEEYYSEFYSSIEQSIKKALTRANDFLSSQISRNNVRWLGNLNFAIVSLDSKKNINISKIGKIKILLIKNGEIIDVTKKIDAKNDDLQKGFYSPKSFGQFTSGKMNNKDKLIILTSEVFDIFTKNSILKKISSQPFLNQKIIEDILSHEKEKLLKTSGVFLLLDTEREREIKESSLNEEELEFSLKDIFKPFVKKRFSFFSQQKGKSKKTKTKSPPKKRLKFGRLNLDLNQKTKKAFSLSLALIAFLLIGFLIFQDEGPKKGQLTEIDLNTAREEIEKAENLIGQNKNQEAFQILETVWNQISPNESDKEIIEIKKEVEEILSSLSNLSIIEDPEKIYEFSARDLAPQGILYDRLKLYFFTPFSNKIVELDLETKESREFFLPVDRERGASSARIISNRPVFFVRPNNLYFLEDGDLKFLASLNEPQEKYSFSYFSNFWTSLYFWDTESREILRYTSYNANSEKWLDSETKKPTDVQSMSVDGSIWMIDSDNSIFRYSGGRLNEEINLSIFPWPRKISQIFTSPSIYRIFLLEPIENRIIITDKGGNIVRQFKSESFNNLVHFSVSQNGNEIYLLNNLKVYRLVVQ